MIKLLDFMHFILYITTSPAMCELGFTAKVQVKTVWRDRLNTYAFCVGW